jgi:phosphohistidine phosphatase
VPREKRRASVKVWIVRHGKAEAKADSGRDEDRALAKRGERQAKWLGKEVARREDRPNRILSSPILRAIDTARLINETLKLPLEESKSLISGKAASTAVELIEELDRDGPWMLVGHNPQLEKLVGVLTEGPGGEGEMKTGQAVLLEIEQHSPVGSAQVVCSLRLAED